jgi:DNA-binding transcriptional ArsR family regulator
LNLNKILRSSCRRKILKALSKKQGMNIMKLVRIVDSTYNEVDRNLRILEDESLVTQQYLDRKRIIRLNFENEKTLVVLKILKLLNEPVDLKQLQRKLRRITEKPFP